MSWWDSIYTKLQGLTIPILGTLSLPTGSETFPIAISNQLNGSGRGYLSIQDLKEIPLKMLRLPDECLILDNTGTEPVVKKFILTVLPEENNYIGNELQNFTNFWTIEETLGETITVEQTREFFKLFSLSLIDDITDNPNTYKPLTNDPTTEGWFLSPPIETDTTIRYGIRGTFVNDILVGSYSDPYQLSGKEQFRDTITSDIGDDFKTTNGVVTPASINLTANLFRGQSLLQDNVANTILYQWDRLRSDGTWTPVDKTVRTVNITPDDVLGQDVFRCTQTFEGIAFSEKFTINDISDGIGIVIDVDSSVDGYIFKADNLVNKNISFTLYNNGNVVPFAQLTSIAYTLDGTSVSNGSTYLGETVVIVDNVITITPAMVEQKLTIKATIVFDGTSYNRTIDIVIVPEAEQLLTIYHDEYFDPTTGNATFPPIVAAGSIEDNTDPNGTWYAEGGVDAETKYLATKKGGDNWVITRVGGIKGGDGKAGAFNAEIFTRSVNQPSTPLGLITGSGIDPKLRPVLPSPSVVGTQWYTEDPKTVGSLWKSRAFLQDVVGDGLYYLLGTWSTPTKVEGVDQILEQSNAEKLFLEKNYV